MAAPPRTHEEIEAQIRELQARKAGLTAGADGGENGEGVPLDASAGSYMDKDIYGSNKGKYEGYVTSIAANDEADVDDDDYESTTLMNNKKSGFTAPTSFLKDFLGGDKEKLNNQGLIETHPPEERTQYFDRRTILAFVEDDHVPFMKKDVPIVHLIPSPFPHVWHRESDNRSNLHHPTINNLNKLLRIFIAQYLHLNVPTTPLVM